jgi:hypothetical protein
MIIKTLTIAIASFSLLFLTFTEVGAQATDSGVENSIDADRTLSFTGAEGFGRYTRGGRGGIVLHVNDLSDSSSGQLFDTKGNMVSAFDVAAYGEGTLRWAIESVNGPRYIVFDVGGVTNLTSGQIKIASPYITIAGQTAPGEGITTRLAKIQAATNDIIIRGMRFRPDDEEGVGDQPKDRDALSMGTSADWNVTYNIIIDHNSMSWALDEVCTAIYGAHDITISYNIIAEALDDNIHIDEGKTSPAPHGYLVLFSEGADRISLIKNLLSTAQARFPQFTKDVTNIEVINNYSYNWQSESMTSSSGSNFTKTANVINNYYKPGFESLARPSVYIRMADAKSGIYLKGNLDEEYRPDNSYDEYAIAHGANNGPVDSSMQSTTPVFIGTGINVLGVEEMKSEILKNAGALLPARDVVDTRIVDNAENSIPGENGGYGRGLIVDKPEDVGGYHWYPTVTRPAGYDTDRDGMPDAWEAENGLDSDLYNPNGRDLDPDYDNIEVYINGLFIKVANTGNVENVSNPTATVEIWIE